MARSERATSIGLERGAVMDIGIIGLGRMGLNMALRLAEGGHHVVVYSRRLEEVRYCVECGPVDPSFSLKEFVGKLPTPQAVWMMIPAGAPVENMIRSLGPLLSKGDILIDGGNSFYKDSMRRAKLLESKGIHFLDIGVSGGIWGKLEGYCLMIGGKKEIVDRLTPIFETLAPKVDRGWGYVGPSGAGHFVKMVHNGIEYGLMEAYAEGFQVLKAKAEFDLDLEEISRIWQYGSVVRSWLLELIYAAFKENKDLAGVKPWVEDTGEGRWTVAEAIDLNVAAPIITASLLERIRSREEEKFSDKLLAALRQRFGGHEVKKEE